MAITEFDEQDEISKFVDAKTLEIMYDLAEEALEDADKTGLHLTGEEVHEWVQRLRSNPKEPMPPCHK